MSKTVVVGGSAGPGVAAAAQRARAWLRLHPLAADAALTLLLAALTGVDARHRGDAVVAVCISLALWVPMIFRRKAPAAVFIVVGLVAFTQWLFWVPVAADLAVLVALYTVAAHRQRVLAIVAATSVEIGVALAIARFAGDVWPRFLLLLTSLVIAALLLGITQQARRSHLMALVDRAARLERERDQQAQLATAAERARIAREIHDIVAHSLSVMIALADGAVLTDQVADARAAMLQVARTGREALGDTRRVLDVLRTEGEHADLAPRPGLDSLESLIATVRATGLRATLTVSGEVFPLPEAAQNAVYRIVQEGLTNTVKHAREADRASVSLTFRHPELAVQITDNGQQVSRPARAESGHGLLGLRERAVLFGGGLDAGPGSDNGWRVSAVLRFPDVDGPDVDRPDVDGPAFDGPTAIAAPIQAPGARR